MAGDLLVKVVNALHAHAQLHARQQQIAISLRHDSSHRSCCASSLTDCARLVMVYDSVKLRNDDADR